MKKQSAFGDILEKLRSAKGGEALDSIAQRAGTQAGRAAAGELSRELGEAAASGGQTFGAESSKALRQGIEEAMPDLIGKARSYAVDEALNLINKAIAPVGAGTAAGALAAGGSGGVIPGAIGGTAGMLAGAALGKRFGFNPAAARIGGGTIGGGLAGLFGGKEQPVHKYAGVTLDYFDDKGALLKEKFPTADDLPDCIKTANIRPPEQVADEQYALLALDRGVPLKKFACVDQGTTAMSVIYFMENRDKLPEGAVKTAAKNLFEACIRYNLLPPEELSKMATDIGTSNEGTAREVNAATQSIQGAVGGGSGDSGGSGGVMDSIKSFFGKSAEVMDITGQSPKPKFAAAPAFDEDYAVITEDGRRLYPIDNWDNIKLACDYWALEGRRMHPEMRRQFAVKVASKAVELGYPLRDESILDAGAPGYTDMPTVKAAMDMRKLAMPGPDNKLHHEFLDELVEKTAELHPEVFAECVRRFDAMHGLDAGWDRVLPSPWESTFGLQKIAEVIWEDAADRVTRAELNNLAMNHGGGLVNKYSQDFIKGFENDPVGVFNSMPLPQKRILARLAAEMASGGRSVMYSETDKDPKSTAKPSPAPKVPA